MNDHQKKAGDMAIPTAPIETTYSGTRFRSRLEARWAVFFDHLRIEWIYEPEGYVLGNGDLYLPDFWLPQEQVWVEVKGAPAPKDLDRLRAATDIDGLPVIYGDERRPCDIIGEKWPVEVVAQNRLLLLGNIPDPNNTGRYLGWLHWMTVLDASGPGMHNVFSIVGAPTHWIFRPLPWINLSQEDFSGISGPTAISWANKTAYLAARSARFEHGQSGCTLEACVLCPCAHRPTDLVCKSCWPSTDRADG